MAVPFPSLAFFQSLQQRTKEAAHDFEKLGYCDTRFGVRVGDELYRISFEVYECVEVDEGGDRGGLDFVLRGPRELWVEMVKSIGANDGADAHHTLNTLTHVGELLALDYEDAEGHDKFFRYMASLQEFFDQARHLDVIFP